MASLVSGRANPYPVPHEPAPGSSRALEFRINTLWAGGSTCWDDSMVSRPSPARPPGCPEGKGQDPICHCHVCKPQALFCGRAPASPSGTAGLLRERHGARASYAATRSSRNRLHVPSFAFLWPHAEVPFWDRRSSPRTSPSPSPLPSYGV